MSKRERIFWILAYTATAILTLLPFFHVGITTGDDFEYYNTAQTNWKHWMLDAEIYAHGAGRFYFLITKIFYYVPYLIDHFGWTKFVQYFTLYVSYLVFAYLVYRLFKSCRLGALTLLLLIFNTGIGYGWHNPPTAYPFYFPFSLIIFLCGLLFFINYTEKKGYWRVIVSAVLLFISYLFYENYLPFTLLFCCFILIRNWQSSGFKKLWKSKDFYKELVPYGIAIILYMVCYVGYRYYLIHGLGNTTLYDGAIVSSHFNLKNFFKILNKLTFYNLPGRIYLFGESQKLIVENSRLIAGHHNTLGFVLTHAPAVAYINALVQCGILWFLLNKADFSKTSWKAVLIGSFAALIFAFSAHLLIAISEKYNADWANWMQVYVTSFFSYFGIMLTIALLIVASLKLFLSPVIRKILAGIWCVWLFCISVVNYYTNDHLSREWEKSQNRITMLQLIAEDNFFETVPENTLFYNEQLLHTSDHNFIICYQNFAFENFFMRIADNNRYHFSQTRDNLQQEIQNHPDMPVYFIQATESKKYGELMMVFSHITQIDTNDLFRSKADKADIFYYSPTKDYVLLYEINSHTDSSRLKTFSVFSNDKQRKITHVGLQEEGLNPLGFSISNLITPTTDTLWIP
ncbi:MAG: hypothetical protein J5644_08125 [Bacteroidales bacterium]|nr:hypothetical protein [Bacteroidales bacterium]